MVEMVHGRIAAGETTVVSTAAVLRCGKQMEKLPQVLFLDSLFPKTQTNYYSSSVDKGSARAAVTGNT
jgi:hypothetical protein